MATVTSLTQSRIEELMQGWQLVGLSQEEINSLIVRLGQDVDSQREVLIEFEEVVVPLIRDDLAAGAIEIENLKDNLLPELQIELQRARELVNNLDVNIVPGLRQEMDNQTQNLIDRPKVYYEPIAPENPDEDERYLVEGDTWYDTDDNNMLRVWNGSAWTTFKLDIPDLSLTIRKFKVGTHMIY